MKKFTSIALATCMVGSLLAFSACGNGTVNGAVKGDYTALNADNQATAMQEITAFETQVSQTNGGSVLGDTTKSDWSVGVSLSAGLNLEYNMAGVSKGKLGVNGSVGIQMYKEQEEMAFKAAADLNVSMKSTDQVLGQSIVTDGKIGAKAYILDNYAYADLSMKGKFSGEAVAEEMSEMAFKLNLTELMGTFLPEQGDTIDPDVGASEPLDFGIVEIIEKAQAIGFPIAYELTDSGLKLKISMTQEWIENMLAQGDGTETTSTSSEAVTAPTTQFEDFKLDLYVVIGAQGWLEQFSADVNLNAKMLDESGAASSYLKVKGGLVFKASPSVEVSVPNSITINPKYFDVTELLKQEMLPGEQPV